MPRGLFYGVSKVFRAMNSMCTHFKGYKKIKLRFSMVVFLLAELIYLLSLNLFSSYKIGPKDLVAGVLFIQKCRYVCVSILLDFYPIKAQFLNH